MSNIWPKLPSILLSFFLLLNGNEAISQIGIEWERSFGGSSSDFSNQIIETNDGGFAVVGYTTSIDGDISFNNGSSDIWITRLDSDGNLIWESSVGGSGDDYGYGIVESLDGGLIVAGYTNSVDGDITSNNGLLDYFIFKLDAAGNLIWQKTYGGSSNDCAAGIIRTQDGNYIVTGFSFSGDGDVPLNQGSSDVWLIKIDPVGELIWSNSYGGSGEEYGTAICRDLDGGYVSLGGSDFVDGDVSSAFGWFDYWVFKIDVDGTLLWEKSYGGSQSELSSSIVQLDVGEYVVGGHTESDDGDVSGFKGASDYWLAHLAVDGSLIKQICLGGSNHDQLLSISKTSNEELLCFGRSFSTDGDISSSLGLYDYWLVRIDTSFNILWERSLGGTNSDFGASVIEAASGPIVVAGYSKSSDIDVSLNKGGSDFWIAKLSGTVDLEHIGETAPSNFKVFPNPSKGKFVVDLSNDEGGNLEIYDYCGKKILEFNSLNSMVEVDLGDVEGGIYILRIRTNSSDILTRLVLE